MTDCTGEDMKMIVGSFRGGGMGGRGGGNWDYENGWGGELGL